MITVSKARLSPQRHFLERRAEKTPGRITLLGKYPAKIVELEYAEARKLGFSTKYSGRVRVFILRDEDYKKLDREGKGIESAGLSSRLKYETVIILPEGFSESTLVHEVLHNVYRQCLSQAERQEFYRRAVIGYYDSLRQKAAGQSGNYSFYAGIASLYFGELDLTRLKQPEIEKLTGEYFAYAGELLLHPGGLTVGGEIVEVPQELRAFFVELGIFRPDCLERNGEPLPAVVNY